ncbi:urease accessory protein UreD [Halalkalibacter urbisdiaboli]|uniref:urease accessory protein UreD n=1 Tax=Halalkalibacter urbisdiaboli TaxID=1960589 RepID=UPI000B42D3C9|nr:urease accessory protein UreD [Halalkalibacter urbisdiaboli]
MNALVHQSLNGKLDLKFGFKRGKTRLLDSYQKPPLRVSRVLYLNNDDVATVYLVDTSGGMAGGDRNDIRIHVSPSAHVQVITQSATKIYPSRIGSLQTEQSIQLNIEDHGHLVWYPETTIPYKDARFKQNILISLKPHSSCYFADILSPGRERHEEKFLYDNVDSTIKIDYDDQCIAFDRQKFEPATFTNQQLGLLDNHCYYANAWFFKPQLEIETRFIQESITKYSDMQFAVTALDPVGLHARWLSKDLCDLKESMKEFYELINT